MYAFLFAPKGVFLMDKSRMIHKNDEITRRFYQVDKLLLENPKYEDLSDGAILTWSILRDRMELSKKNSEVFSDEEGYLFLIFTDEELAQILHRNRKTANARKKELEKFGLLYNVRMGNQEPNRLYLLEPEKCDPEEYISNQYRKKKKAELIEKQSEKEKAQKKKYMLIEVPEDDEINFPQASSLGGVMMSKKRTSVMGKKRTSRRVKNGHPDVQNLGCNDTEITNTNLNDTDKNLNLNLIDIYDLLWETKIPNNLKSRIKIMIVNKQISLTANQLLELEDAYFYQIKKEYIIPDCDFNYSGALNDIEFSNTIVKMLETVKDIRNIKGLIQEWVQLAFEHKLEQL